MVPLVVDLYVIVGEEHDARSGIPLSDPNLAMLARGLGAAEDDVAELLAPTEDERPVDVEWEAVLLGEVVLRQHVDFPTTVLCRDLGCSEKPSFYNC